MSKLEAKNGRIDKVSQFDAESMTVLFRRAAISTNGDMGQVTLNVSGDQVIMTFAQALSFASEVMKRCQ